MASNVADIYHQLSLDLFDNVVERLRERGSVYLEKQPYLWQLDKMNQMGALNDENVRLIAERSGIAEEQLRYIIQNEGYKVYTTTAEQLAEAMGNPADFDPKVMEDLISYSNQVMFDVDNLINTTLPKSVQAVYKSIVEETVAKVVTGLSTSDMALNETIMKWHQKGFYGFTDKSGKNWRADNYARTIIKSTVMRVRNEMRTRPAKELGIDTFYYSVKSSARELCAPLQHQIVTTGLARVEAGEKILALSDYGYGSPGGCLGINCGHILTPFIPGANYKPELGEDVRGIAPEQAIENATIEAKQRAMERSIRFSKEQLHVAEKLGDAELIDKYRLKLRKQKHALKSYLNEHSFLRRDEGREKYYYNPDSYAKQEARLNKEFEEKKRYHLEQKEMREKFESALKNGIIKTELNNENFENHVRGTRGYENYLKKNLAKGAPPPSYLTITKEECQALIDRYAGTGQFRYNPKSNKMQEIISHDGPIGTYIDQRTGEIIENDKDFRIHYSKTGAHIVPTIRGKRRRK
ncbi:minor capsid protein [Streptococcus phage Javan291]|nr:minor capsid protein [Streptococcus phage Javan291]